MRIVLIGAGNVATHLGRALQLAGCELVQLFSRTPQSAEILGSALGIPYATSLSQLVSDADVYLTMLPDHVLPTLVPNIVKGREQALFVHTAGSLPLSIWQPFATRCGVLYPMQTFSKQKNVDFHDVPLFIEADGETDKKQLITLAQKLSNRVTYLDSAGRESLHMAAVFACNFPNHLYTLSAHLLAKHGIPFDVMLPLVDETTRKIHSLAPSESQTGPAVRHDEKVILGHLSLLNDEPALQQLYKLLSDNIQDYHDKLRPTEN